MQDSYRLNAGIVLINGEKHILICERKDIRGAWQMPQGGIEAGESVVEAGLRELLEETGVKAEPDDIIAITKNWITYDYPIGSKMIEQYGFKGQKQKWLLIKFSGNDRNINLDTADQEFVDFKWVEPYQAIANIVPFKRLVYERVLAEFGLIKQSSL